VAIPLKKLLPTGLCALQSMDWYIKPFPPTALLEPPEPSMYLRLLDLKLIPEVISARYTTTVRIPMVKVFST